MFVFPLSQVLLYPASAKPLHVFEPRYVQMVHDSIRDNVPMAIGFVDDPTGGHYYHAGQELNFIRPIVGFGKPLIVDVKPDGSLIVFLQGRGKARLGKVILSNSPYIVCEAEEIQENHELSASGFHRFALLQKVLMKWMETNIPDSQVRHQFLSQIKTPNEVIGCFASYMLADHDLQQLILEVNDINEKVKMLNSMVASGELL